LELERQERVKSEAPSVEKILHSKKRIRVAEVKKANLMDFLDKNNIEINNYQNKYSKRFIFEELK